MKKLLLASLLALQAGLCCPVSAQEPPPESVPEPLDPTSMLDPSRDTGNFSINSDGDINSLATPGMARLSVTVEGIANGQPIPPAYAYCAPDGRGGTRAADNISPALHWFGAPSETKSYAVLVVDEDVPANLGLANDTLTHKFIPAHAPRQNFTHWVLIDIPTSLVSIPEGADSKGIVPGGKPAGQTNYGIDGQNDYAAKAHQGKGGGYDGPCPPWNDYRPHHYHFTVYALDVPSLDLTGNFTGEQALTTMRGHIVGIGEVMGTYITNAKLGAR
jgi:Raf kinase inhibitor-like YbhB/YbcL family protein